MTTRLTQVAVAEYDHFDGYAMANGLPPLEEMDWGRLCRMVYYLVTKDMDSKQLDKFKADLWMPVNVEEIDDRSPWSPENERAALAGLKAMIGQA